MPPCFAFWFGLVCRLMIFSFSTTTFPAGRSIDRTFPVLPRSRPETTTTVSPFRILLFRSASTMPLVRSALQNFRCQGNDLHEFLPAELTGDGTEYTRSNRLALFVDQDARISIKLNIRSILPTNLLRRSDNDGPTHIPLLHAGLRDRLLDCHHHDISERRIASSRPPENMKTHGLFRSRIIGHIHIRIVLNHRYIPTRNKNGGYEETSLPTFRVDLFP